MAEEKKEKANTVDANFCSRQNKEGASSEGRDQKIASTKGFDGDQNKEGASSEGRDQKIASTKEATSKSLQDKTPAKPQEPAAPAEPDWKDHYARLLADFDNYKKRAQRDREDTYRYAESDILKDVLPTVDNLALALQHAKNPDDEFVKGVQLVYDNLLKALKEHGAEPFDCVGQDLDTEKMEAIATLPDDRVPEGKVSIESKRGWMLRDKVLRAAQVVVSSGKPQ